MECFGKCPSLFQLEWKQTSPPVGNLEVLITAPQLSNFTFESLLRCAKCPTIVNFSDHSAFYSLNIRSYHGLDLSPIEPLPHHISVVCIHVETSDPNDYVSPVAGIWRNLGPGHVSLINIEGLKSSPRVTRAKIDDMVSSAYMFKNSQVVLIE